MVTPEEAYAGTALHQLVPAPTPAFDPATADRANRDSYMEAVLRDRLGFAAQSPLIERCENHPVSDANINGTRPVDMAQRAYCHVSPIA
jgi:hypothetical protein